MVITSPSPNVNDSNSVEPSESVEEPPIRPFSGHEKEQIVSRTDRPGHNPGGGQFSREEVCKYAHTVEAASLAAQLGIDLKYIRHPTPNRVLSMLTYSKPWPQQQRSGSSPREGWAEQDPG